MSTERDTPTLYDTAGGTQAAEADTNSQIQMCNYIEANKRTHANLLKLRRHNLHKHRK